MGHRRIIGRRTLDALLVALFALITWIWVSKGTVLHIGEFSLGLRSLRNPAILFFLLLTLRLWLSDFQFLGNTGKVARFAFFYLFLFVAVVLVAKMFVSLTAVFHFHRVLDRQDWLHTFATDFSLAFAAGVLILLLVTVSRWASVRYVGVQRLINANIWVLTMGVFFAAVLYSLIAYVYFEWGSFIEPAHILAIRMAGVGPEATDMFFRWRTLGMVLGFASVFGAVWWLSVWMRGRWSVTAQFGALIVCLMPFLLGAKLPNESPHRVAPTVQSPLLMLLRPPPGHSRGLDAHHLLATLPGDYTAYQPPQTDAPIKPEFRSLQGVLAGKNVIFFVMESVRYQNIMLHGYERDTMPTLTRLANEAMVFEQAYVTQPRSSKAFAAFGIGMTPDPRLVPVAWEEQRVEGADTLIKRLIDDAEVSRRYFMATAQPAGSDNVDDFFRAASGYRADRVETFETISSRADFDYADQGLVQSFLDWVDTSDQRFLSVLWTECAHIPYDAPLQPFGNLSLKDRYDNCLFTVDDALKQLVDGLKARGQYDDTVLVVMGDHGEALGENFDRGHGNYLYEHSLRVPMLLVNPEAFPERRDISARFQLKDLPSTLLYLLGQPSQIYDSVNIFSKGDEDTLYFSNVYQDFKLGLLRGQHKFVYRPTYDLFYFFDLEHDPSENINIVNRLPPEETTRLKKQMLSWYWYHTQRINRDFPRPAKVTP